MTAFAQLIELSWRIKSSFSSSISLVVKARALEQMVVPHALRIIAPVEDLLFWPVSIYKKPRNNVSGFCFPINAPEIPIPICIDSGDPKPAILRLINPWPEPISNGHFWRHLRIVYARFLEVNGNMKEPK